MTIYGFHKLTSTLKSMENVGSDDRYFEGLLTVQMKDKQGEVTIVDELYKVLPVWIDRGAPISDTHSNRIVGKGINYSRTTVKNDEGHELPAIKITGKIFKNYELDNVIWNKIKNNEYKGLSFGGATRSARSPIKMKDGSTAYALSDLEHYEVAVCADPAVPMAIITDFNQIAKANFNSSVRDDGKMVIQCDNMGCYVNKDSLIKIEDDDDDNTQVTVLDEWENETHPDKNGKTEGIRTTKADEDKPLNKPMRDDGDKKFKVYVKDPKTGKTVTVRFGDPNMEIKRDDPERRASFRARHDCENAKDITTPKYWSCKMWEKETSVTDHTNKADLMTVMEGDKPENYNEVEAGRQRGRAIDKTEPTGLTARQLKLWKEIQEDDKEDSDNQYYNKFMEKKEMMDAVEDLPDKEKVKKSIVFLEKHGYQVFTEDKNNGTGINDTEREIPEKKLPIKGSLSQELPRGIQQANLNESQTFEQKVQALIREGKSRESAEKIVGSFVHKVEASSGSGGAGIGGANMTNGGTITTQTGGANNPLYNKKKPKAADISNTGSGGTTEGAFNQNPPNAQRLNNKADDEEDEEVPAPQEDEERPEWAWLTNRHKSKATREVNKVHALLKLNKVRGQCENCGLKARGMRNEGDKPPVYRSRKTRKQDKKTRDGNSNMKFEESFEDGSNYENKSLAELKKIKRNPTAPKSTQNSMTNDVNNYNNWSRLQAGVQGHQDIDSQEYARRLQINAVRAGRGMTEKYPMPPRTGTKQTKRTVGASRASLGGGSGKGSGALGKSSGGKPHRSLPVADKDNNESSKKPNKKRGSDRDDTNDPPTPKIRYGRGGDSAARQLKMSLDELIKKLPKAFNENDDQDDTGNDRGTKWQSPDEIPDEFDHTDLHGLTQRGNSRLGNTDEVLGDSVVQNTSSPDDVQSSVGRRIRERGHGDKSGMQATMSRRNAEILRSNIEKSLDELMKLDSKLRRVHNALRTRKAPKRESYNIEAVSEPASQTDDGKLGSLPLSEPDSEGETRESVDYEGKKTPYGAPSKHKLAITEIENNLAEMHTDNYKDRRKAMTYRKTRGNVEMKYPTVGEEVWDSKQQKRVKETKTPKRTMALEKALYELKKLQVSGGLGSRGLGTDHGHTQGSGDSTQVTLVQPRPEDDRVSSKRTTKEPKE